MKQGFSSLKATIAALLAEIEWEAHDPMEYAIAFKEYQTAVGVKEAQAQLSPLNDPASAALLKADYQSEGRNILSSLWYPIPTDISSDDLRALVQRFSDEVDAAVKASYAARLMPGNDDSEPK